MAPTAFTFRRFKDGETKKPALREQIFVADKSYKCPTYVLRSPPCQASCPSGHDIRGWLNIVRGVEKAPADQAASAHHRRRPCVDRVAKHRPLSQG